MTIFSFVGEEWNVSQPPPLHKNLELALRIKKVNWVTKQTPVSQDCSLKTQYLKIINKFLILGDRTSHTKACVEGLSHWWYCGAPPPAWRIPRTTFTRGLVSRRARPQPARGARALPGQGDSMPRWLHRAPTWMRTFSRQGQDPFYLTQIKEGYRWKFLLLKNCKECNLPIGIVLPAHPVLPKSVRICGAPSS